MRIILLIAFACSSVQVCDAQDSIFLRNKTVIPAKVIEIGETLILYKKAENLSGPDYKISVNNVKRIVFENGAVEAFERPAHPPVPGPRRSFNEIEAPSKRVATIIKNKKLYPRSLPDNFLSAGYYAAQTVYYNVPDGKVAHGLYVKYERLVLNEVVGIGVTPFMALNQKHRGAKLNITAYTKFFGKLRIGVGPYYAITRQNFTRSYWPRDNSLGENSFSTEVYLKDDNATLGSVGFSGVAQLHFNSRYLLSLGADIGGGVHINNYKDKPREWDRSRVGSGVTQGWLNVGVVRRW